MVKLIKRWNNKGEVKPDVKQGDKVTTSDKKHDIQGWADGIGRIDSHSIGGHEISDNHQLSDGRSALHFDTETKDVIALTKDGTYKVKLKNENPEDIVKNVASNPTSFVKENWIPITIGIIILGAIIWYFWVNQ